MPSQESGLVTRTIPKVNGGVSQRSSVVRDTSQCSELINGYPDPTFGMSRRPATVFNTVVENFNEPHYLYTFSFSPTEKYALMVKDGGLTVVNLLSKEEMTVDVADGSDAYLTSSNPAKDFQAMTVGNDTFILNRSITTAQDNSTKSTADIPTGLIWVRLGDQATEYTVTLDGTPYSITTSPTWRPEIDTRNIALLLRLYAPQGQCLSTIAPSGSWANGDKVTITDTVSGKSSTHTILLYGNVPNPVNQDVIFTMRYELFWDPTLTNGTLGDLQNVTLLTNWQIGDALFVYGIPGQTAFHLVATTTSAHGKLSVINYGTLADTYEVTQLQSSVIIRKKGASPGLYVDFDIEVSDGLGSQALEVFKGTAQKFSDLPLAAPAGFKIHIVGELTSEVDDFYVAYDTTDSPTGSGTWIESLKGDELTSLDAATLPHILEPDGMGGWTFGPATWNPRVTGSLVTNPMPSFVGKTIDDMFFFKNRLGFISKESRVMSQSGQYFNFFRKSCSQLLDEERIDVASNSAGINKVHFATFQDGELILWGDAGQIAVSGTPLLTPKTIGEEPVGAFKTSPDAKPVASGKASYFLTDRKGKTQVSEYTTTLSSAGTKLSKSALDLTDEIPTYINTPPLRVEAVSEMELIFVQGEVETIP